MPDVSPPSGTWIHVFEEDSDAGAVFKPEDADIPLSRRPRERVTFGPGGAAKIWSGGPDDRPAPLEATWTDENGMVVVRDRRGTVRLRVIEHSAGRMLAKRS
jgi:hypothetical protein